MINRSFQHRMQLVYTNKKKKKKENKRKSNQCVYNKVQYNAQYN